MPLQPKCIPGKLTQLLPVTVTCYCYLLSVMHMHKSFPWYLLLLRVTGYELLLHSYSKLRYRCHMPYPKMNLSAEIKTAVTTRIKSNHVTILSLTWKR